MPRAKPLDAYQNANYSALWSHVAATKGEMLLRLEPRPALTLRHEFYAWRRVALANPDKALKLGINLQALNDVRISIVPEGLKLYHKDDAVGMEAIRQALEGAGITPAAPPVAEAVPESKVLSQEEIDALFSPEAIVNRLQGYPGVKKEGE